MYLIREVTSHCSCRILLVKIKSQVLPHAEEGIIQVCEYQEVGVLGASLNVPPTHTQLVLVASLASSLQAVHPLLPCPHKIFLSLEALHQPHFPTRNHL